MNSLCIGADFIPKELECRKRPIMPWANAIQRLIQASIASANAAIRRHLIGQQCIPSHSATTIGS